MDFWGVSLWRGLLMLLSLTLRMLYLSLLLSTCGGVVEMKIAATNRVEQLLIYALKQNTNVGLGRSSSTIGEGRYPRGSRQPEIKTPKLEIRPIVSSLSLDGE